MAKNLQSFVQDNELDLSMNGLQSVPNLSAIASLTMVTSLDLSNNKIQVLPDDFSSLKRITKVDLSKNQLTSLPASLGEMVQLQYLDLRGNRISALPPSLGNLRKLKWLDLKDNPLSPELAKVAGQCLNEKQCQECATNVVAYLAQVDAKLKQEMQNRLQKQKEAEEKVKAREAEMKVRQREEKKLERQRQFEARQQQEKESKMAESVESKHVEDQGDESDANKKLRRKHHVHSRVSWRVRVFVVLLLCIVGLVTLSAFCVDQPGPLCGALTKFMPLAVKHNLRNAVKWLNDSLVPE